jgi:4-amino-4-deoxy-L-arabinose transferase-like glycosyltransferase
MKFKLSKFWLLLLIIGLAAILRFWQLGRVPPSPDWDEAALGYNAYSIMRTGRDEYGTFLPLILRSFDDYKPAIYTYFIIPAIKIFGLNVFAVRLPAAILGVLAVIMVYFLVIELTGNQAPALVASFLLAISPWHLQFSRIAFESNVGVLFNILWVYFLLKSFKKPLLLPVAAFLAGVNLYVYQAEKIFTPLLVLAVAIIFRKEIIKIKRRFLISGLIVGFVSLAPFTYMVKTTPEIFLRAKGTSLTADQTPFLARTVEKIARDYQEKNYLGLILDNRRITYLVAAVDGYLSHFDLNWLFLSGDEARHHAPGMGLLYLWELPFLLLGIYELIFNRKINKKAKSAIFAWFLIAPIPASFTSGVPHAVRTLRFLPMMQIFTALGILRAWQIIGRQKNFIRIPILLLTVTFMIFNFFYYLNQYFVQQKYFNSASWQYGYEPAIGEIQKIENNYQKIIVSNQPYLDQSYMFFLFYLKFDPAEYQKLGGTQSGGFAEEHRGFFKYTFRPIKWAEEEKRGTLFVGRPADFPAGVKVLKIINFLNHQPAILLVEG